MRDTLRSGWGIGRSVLVAACLLMPATIRAEVRWETDLGRARAESLRVDRPILLDFWATWCGPCNAMDTQVFSQERVALAMQKVLPVRVDMDRQQVLAREYSVAVTPTLILVDGYGNELFRYSGFIGAERLIPLLDALPADLSRIHGFAGALRRDKNDFDALRGLAHALREHSLYLPSNTYYLRALRTRQGQERSDARAEMLSGLASNYAALQQSDEAEKIRRQLRREFPGRSGA